MTSHRIALVVDHFLPRVGGIELHVADVARHLAACGHSVEVITTTPGAEQFDGIPVQRLDGPLLPRFQVLCHRRPLVQLRQRLGQRRYDIVHAHSSIVSPLAYGATWHCRHLGIPSVLTTHSLLGPHTFWFGGVNRLLDLMNWPTRLSTVSRATATALQKLSGRSDIVVLPNGIDATLWRTEPEAHERLRVTSVMRLNVKKRPQDLVAAIPGILKRLPAGMKPLFTFVGDGPCRNRLERQVSGLGIADCVEFLGFRSRQEIKEIFRTTDLFVLPTKHEAFGIAVLEARSAGLPIVAMNHGGVCDIVEHGRHGFLADDRRQLADHIVRLLEDEPLRLQMAATARRGLEKYEWDRIIADHLQVYTGAMPHQRVRTARPLPV